MLVLTRKLGEDIVIDGLNITIKVVQVRGKQVRLGIECPKEVKVYRGEVLAAINKTKEEEKACHIH